MPMFRQYAQFLLYCEYNGLECLRIWHKPLCIDILIFCIKFGVNGMKKAQLHIRIIFMLHHNVLLCYTTTCSYVTPQCTPMLHHNVLICYTTMYSNVTPQRAHMLHHNVLPCYTTTCSYVTPQCTPMLHHNVLLCVFLPGMWTEQSITK